MIAGMLAMPIFLIERSNTLVARTRNGMMAAERQDGYVLIAGMLTCTITNALDKKMFKTCL